MINNRFSDYIPIALTIAFTVYGQLILKFRMDTVGQLPLEFTAKTRALFLLVFDPWIFSGLIAAFLASLAWMAALSKLDLSHAYPFMSLNFVLVLLLSVVLLNEPLTTPRVIGIILIVLGTVIASQ